MPIPIKGMRLFIGAPGGLDDERRCIRETIELVNKEYALKNHGTLYMPVEWGSMTGGTGEPQSRINPELEECDYCIIIFWNYMGERNTVIEFEIATQCKDNSDKPMKQVVVFFKQPSLGEERSPSEELQKVLTFKESIRKNHLFIEFKDLDRFKELIKQHLIEWLSPSKTTPSVSSVKTYFDESRPEL
jgi:hypothetical protein